MIKTSRRHLAWAAAALVAAIALLWIALSGSGFSVDRMTEAVEELPTFVFVAAMLALPLVGVPISLFLLVAGAKYGVVNGMLLAAACMLFHNVAAFWFTHTFLKKPITRLLTKREYEIPAIPDKHRLWFTAAFTGIPGIPYTIKLYLLALTDIPFSIYVGIGWPIYSLSNLVFIGMGGAVKGVSLPIVAAAVVVGAACWLGTRYLKRKLNQEDSSETGKP